MEVRRAKLSRYLRGLVFRCHLCTYTSASADNLRAHAAKHRRVKPYRCRLCYFDCARLGDLEAHLCAEHQVTGRYRSPLRRSLPAFSLILHFTTLQQSHSTRPQSSRPNDPSKLRAAVRAPCRFGALFTPSEVVLFAWRMAHRAGRSLSPKFCSRDMIAA